MRKKIELAACMGIRPYDEAKAIAQQYVEHGLHHAQDQGGPASRRKTSRWSAASATASAIGSKLRIDPNMGYTPEVAFPLARDLETLQPRILRAADAR